VASAELRDNAAIGLGAWEATRRRVGLRLVGRDDGLVPWLRDGAAGLADDGARGIPREVLDGFVVRVAADYPDLVVSGSVYIGSPASGLVAASVGASLVVVAADARVRYGGLLAGLVSVQVAAHAQASVMVVPTTDAPTRRVGVSRVVVGVDGSTGSSDAVAFAFDEAHARGADLHAIYVWESADHPRRRPIVPYSGAVGPAAGAAGAADRMLRDATGGWEDKYCDVAVIREAVYSDNPVRGLNNAAGGADLIVVGARGSGGFDTLALGSVSDGLVRYSPCRVAVVRSGAAGPR
jgi:nucleotide-binding universal stress UspA family protein